MSRLMSLLVAGCALAAAVAVVAGCEDGAPASRAQIAIFVDPPEGDAVPMTGVNAGNVQCRYTLRARAAGGTMSEVEWLGMRIIIHHALGTDTTRVSAQEFRGFWSVSLSSVDNETGWGWGGPAQLVPVTID